MSLLVLVVALASTMRTNGRLDALVRDLAKLDQRSQGTAASVRALEAVPGLVEVAASARASVFTVRSGGSQGTAFAIRSDPSGSWLVTNHHVVADRWLRGDRRVLVKQGPLRLEGTVRRVSIAEDLALIRVGEEIQALRIVKAVPRAGTEIFVVGSPVGLTRTVTEGIISGSKKRAIQVSAPISPGSSGSPVIDMNGAVVGVINSKMFGPGVEGLAFAVKASEICNVLRIC